MVIPAALINVFKAQKGTDGVVEVSYGGETATEYTAADLGGDYIFVLACKGIPANATDITFTVTTFYTADGNAVCSEVETFVIGEIPADTLPTA